MCLTESEPTLARSNEVEVVSIHSTEITITDSCTTAKRARRTSTDRVGDVIDTSQHHVPHKRHRNCVISWCPRRHRRTRPPRSLRSSYEAFRIDESICNVTNSGEEGTSIRITSPTLLLEFLALNPTLSRLVY